MEAPELQRDGIRQKLIRKISYPRQGQNMMGSIHLVKACPPFHTHT